MTLLTLRDVDLAFGSEPLMERASLELGSGERVCLLGRNGASKTTVFRLLTGEQQPDSGAGANPA